MMKKYPGGCQCGTVRYEAELDLDQPVLECNCSRCGRLGFLFQFVPAEAVTVDSGESSLTTYKFNRHVIDHLFCSVCGVESFARGEKEGQPLYAINVRTLDDVDLEALTRTPVNGKDF